MNLHQNTPAFSKKTVLLFLLAACFMIPPQLLLAGGDKKEKPKWVKYESDAGKFKVKFPGNPEVTSENTVTGKRHKAVARFGKGTYFATFMLHETPMTQHKKMADVSLQAFNDKLAGVIKKQSPWDVKGHKGIKAVIELPEQNSLVDYRVVLIGQHQYQIIVVAPKSDWDEKISEKFFKKFKVKL